MEWSQACIDLIKEFEGLKLKAYLCPAGIWSIGYGFTTNVHPGDEVTASDAEILLGYTLKDIIQELEPLCITNDIELAQNELDAVLAFIYNIGFGAFIKSTMFTKLKRGDKNGAANEFRKWVRGGGKILPGLVRRRAAEEKLFRGGDI